MEILRKEKSCGCLVIDEGKVLLIKQTKGHWGLPKGHVEENETEKETALREVKEETNYDVEIVGDYRFVERYITDTGIDKEVVYFIAKKVGGDAEKQEAEVTDIKWCSFDEAIDTVTFDNMKELLKNAFKALEN